MKKINLLLLSSVALIVIVGFIISCSESDIIQENNKPQPSFDKFIASYAYKGWIYCIWDDGSARKCGSYLRPSYDVQIQDCPDQVGGNCLPEHSVIETLNYQGDDFNVESSFIQEVDNWKIMLDDSLSVGIASVKNAYTSTGWPLLELWTEADFDLRNDTLTIKNFSGCYHIVYNSATLPSQGPDYQTP